MTNSVVTSTFSYLRKTEKTFDKQHIITSIDSIEFRGKAFSSL